MKCPRCGSNMVEKPPSVIYTSNPPQWDSVMWCACGYSEDRGRVRGQTQEQMLHKKWERANVEFSGGAPLHGATSAGTKGYASESDE